MNIFNLLEVQCLHVFLFVVDQKVLRMNENI